MNRVGKITTVAVGVTITGLVAIAAPTIVSAVGWGAQTFAADEVATSGSGVAPASAVSASPTPDATPAEPEKCPTRARIQIAGGLKAAPHASLRGVISDSGPSEMANGTVTLNEAGEIYSYTVAAGDSPIMIGDRFCIDYGSVMLFSHVDVGIGPGDVLYLHPDPSIPWVDPHAPFDTEGVTSTIPYFTARSEMSHAVAADDLTEAARLWPRLAPDVAPEVEAVVSAALRDGDLERLRLMFP